MKLFFSLLIFSFPLSSFGAWICEKAASIKEGESIMACGVGIGADESLARQKALLNAKLEFKAICEDSYDCRSRETIVTPLRNSCTQLSNSTYRCYRGLQYQILKFKTANRAQNNEVFDKKLKKIETEIKQREGVLNKKKHLLHQKKKLAKINHQINGEISPDISGGKTILLNTPTVAGPYKRNQFYGFSMDVNTLDNQSEIAFSYVRYNNKSFGHAFGLSVSSTNPPKNMIQDFGGIYPTDISEVSTIDSEPEFEGKQYFYTLSYQSVLSLNISDFLFNFGAGVAYTTIDDDPYNLGVDPNAPTADTFLWLTSFNIHYVFHKHFSLSFSTAYRAYNDYLIPSGLVSGIGISLFL